MIRVRPARAVDLPGVAAVLQDAFDDKMRIIFGSHPEKIRTVLEAVYSGPVRRGYEGVIVAEDQGRIVGTLLVEPMNYTPQETRAFERTAIREFGLPRMMMASFYLWLLGYHPAPGEGYISDMGVASDWQGQGVGQAMLRHADAWARAHGYGRLTLWVSAANAPAIHVYEKTGFVLTRTRSNWLTRLAFGIRRWHFMEKWLDEASFPDDWA
jgi:ribosomal protein S18 acetylase RimI-like enzyme